jgi:hypothetical protein
MILEKGKHSDPSDGMCLLEAVALMAGEPFTDHPACVSPVLAEFGRTLNDALPDDQRQLLAPLIPLLVGTVDAEADERDGLRCAHWLVAHWLPAWLDLASGLEGHAAELRALPAPKSWPDSGAWVLPLADTWTAAIAFRGARWRDAHLLEDAVSHAVISAVGAARHASGSKAPAVATVTVALEARNVALVALATVPPERREDMPRRMARDAIDLFTELVEGRH